MIDRNFHEQPATPEQATEMFTQIGELTALKGVNFGSTCFFDEVPVTTPEEVAVHFPVPESTSLRVRRTALVTQTLDRTTGEPSRNGVVGMVTFRQIENRDESLMYATNVNYHVITNDGTTHHIERHVTNIEHGPHRIVQKPHRVSTPQSMTDTLTGLVDLRNRVAETRGLERSLGLLAVSQPEAEQILEVLSDLNGHTS